MPKTATAKEAGVHTRTKKISKIVGAGLTKKISKIVGAGLTWGGGRVKVALLAVGMIFTVMSVAPAPAMADAVSDCAAHGCTYFVAKVQVWSTGHCLDSNYAGRVYTDGCQWPNTWQNWEFRVFRDGWTEIKDQKTRMCLTHHDDGTAYTFMYPGGVCSNWGAYHQLEWWPYGHGWGNFHLQSYIDKSLCLDATGGLYAAAWKCNNGTYQTWRLLHT
jgi:hypothetical protein